MNDAVFLSHAAVDARVMRRLKEMLEQRVAGDVEIFLSCDGQSIPFGQNWVDRTASALKRARVMFVLLTPSSVQSNWVYFEAGYVRGRGIERVVPVGLFGVDLEKIPPPLGLLEGFNVRDAAGLNNLVATMNEELGRQDRRDFRQTEYEELTRLARHPGARNESRVHDLVKSIWVDVKEASMKTRAWTLCTEVEKAMVKLGYDVVRVEQETRVEVRANGVVARFFKTPEPPSLVRHFDFVIRTEVARQLLPVADTIVRLACGSVADMPLIVEFRMGTVAIINELDVTGRTLGTGVRPTAHDTRHAAYGGLEFQLDNMGSLEHQWARMTVFPLEDRIPTDDLLDLIRVLVDTKLVRFRTQAEIDADERAFERSLRDAEAAGRH